MKLGLSYFNIIAHAQRNIEYCLKMKNKFLVCTIFLYSCIASAANQTEIIIAVASDFKPALEELASEFSKTQPEVKISVTPGSSGKLYEQIKTGAAPFHLFFSADMDYPKKLVLEGESNSKVVPYATGKLIAWSPKHKILDIQELKKAEFKKISVANFEHAPYGKIAKQALISSALFDLIKEKLVTAETVAQAAQFAETGAADVGLVAYSFIFSPALKEKGHFLIIPQRLYTPLLQGMILLKKGEAEPAAKLFAEYISSKKAKAIIKKYGFEVAK